LHAGGGDQRLKGGAPAAEEEDVDEGVVEARRAERVAARLGWMRRVGKQTAERKGDTHGTDLATNLV
jgi:hypothetical protein